MLTRWTLPSSAAEVIFHEAAIASVARSLREPRLTNDVNENGTIVGDAYRLQEWRPEKLVSSAGSSAVYGVPERQVPCSKRASARLRDRHMA